MGLFNRPHMTSELSQIVNVQLHVCCTISKVLLLVCQKLKTSYNPPRPIQGWQVICWLQPAIINMYTKFEVSSFNPMQKGAHIYQNGSVWRCDVIGNVTVQQAAYDFLFRQKPKFAGVMLPWPCSIWGLQVICWVLLAMINMCTKFEVSTSPMPKIRKYQTGSF